MDAPALSDHRVNRTPDQRVRGVRVLTPDQRVRVFISSTMGELAAEREAVQEAVASLRLTPVLFETGARPHPPRELYCAYLEQSDIFVGVYGERYGWIAPDMEVSGLEDEYLLSAGKPKLVYVKSPAPAREERLEALLDRMRSSAAFSYKHFSTPGELRELVADDLALLLTEHFEMAGPLTGSEPMVPHRGSVEVPGAAGTARVAGAAGLQPPLPRPLTPIVGRVEEIGAVRALLLRDDVRLLTLTGTGGTGKTRLAMEVLPDLVGRLGAVYFVELAAIHDSRLVASTVAQALGIREVGDKPPADSLKDVLRDKRVLLVLDNFEQVAEAAELVADLLAACPRLTVLVTSRTPLHLRAEREFPVPPLAVPVAVALDDAAAVAATPAVELFAQRARDVQADFAVDAQNAAAVGEICRRLDGLPLAIELAAARVRLLSPQAILARLERRLPLLTGGARDLPHRQQTMRDTIAWSHSLLGERSAVLFRRLAAFMGGADLAAVEAVGNDDGAVGADVLNELQELVEKNLLRVAEGIDGGPRFRMLETIREYAVDRLAETDEKPAVHRLHAELFLGLVREAEPHLTSGRRQVWLRKLEVDLDNIRAALTRSLAGKVPIEIGLELMSRLVWLWYLRGRIVEGRGLTEAMLRHPGATARSVERAKILMAAGALAWCQGDFAAARTWLDESVDILREERDSKNLALPATVLAATLASQQDYAGARAHYDEAIAAAREAGDQWTEAFASSWLGDVYLLTGDLETARGLEEESVALFERLGDDWGRAMVLHSLAVVLGYLAEPERARSMFEESARLMREADDKYALARVLSGAAELAVREKDPERAQGLLEEAIGLWVEMGNETGLQLCLGALARIAALRGQPERATRLLGAARDPLRTVGSLSAAGDGAEYQEQVADLRRLLGETAWSGEFQRGRAMTVKEAVAYALAGH